MRMPRISGPPARLCKFEVPVNASRQTADLLCSGDRLDFGCVMLLKEDVESPACSLCEAPHSCCTHEQHLAPAFNRPDRVFPELAVNIDMDNGMSGG